MLERLPYSEVMPEVNRTVKERNYQLIQYFKEQVLKGEDPNKVLDEKILRNISIRAGTEEPAKLIHFMETVADHVDLF